MKRIRIMGLCLIAVFAFSAVVATGAQAGEVGECVKVPKVLKKYNGKYTDKNCTTASVPANTGKYEWSPGVEAAKKNFTAKTKAATLASAAGTIACKASTTVGEWTGTKTNHEVITFTGCKLSVTSGECHSLEEAEGSGIIKSFEDTTLIDNGEKGPSGGEPAPGEVWNSFAPAATSPYGIYATEFKCAPGVVFRSSGSVSGVVTPVNVTSAKLTTAFGAGKGEQDLNTEFNQGTGWERTGPNVETATGSGKGAKVEIKA
jgi:hypothetical protein